MADGGERSGSDYVTFRELVDREQRLRDELKGYVNERDDAQVREMNSRFTNFGHEVAKQFVEERENNRKEQAPVDPNFRSEVISLAKGNHGWGGKLIGIGIIILGVGVLAHAPFLKAFLPI